MFEMMTGSILKKISEPGLEIDPEVFEKLVAAGGTTDDNFGWSATISSDGSTIVVGAYGDDDKGSFSGSTYIFTKQTNGRYLQSQKLVASDGTANDYFGWSVVVSSDGSTIIVSAYGDSDKGTNSGSAYIFTKQSNGSYLQIQKLVPSDGVAYDYFGWSVTTSGDGSTIVVGAYGDDNKGFNSGSAYVFTKQTNGSYLETQKLVASDGAPGDNFGITVTISENGSTIIVGAPYDDDKGNNSGSAYVFTKQANDGYLQTNKLIPSDGAAGDYFGTSVAISGNGSTIIVGTYSDDDKGTDSGSVYVFTKKASGSYLQFQKLLASNGTGADRFGYSVAISSDGSTIIVGAYLDDDRGIDSGSAYIFTKKANGSYLQIQKLVPSDSTGVDYFGYSVTTSQTSVVIGAYNHLGKGAVYVF